MGLYRTGMVSSGGGGGGSIVVDDSLSTTSTNPVENRVITNALNNKQNQLTAGSGISISSNTISIDSNSMSGYQRYIDFDSSPVTQWSNGYEGQLKYAVMSDGSSQLYRYSTDISAPYSGWYRIYETNVQDAASVTVSNSPLTNIIISTTDIGEGQSLDAGTLYLVVS